MRVESGDKVLIGGFIITGAAPKKVIIRGIGRSLSGFGVQGALDDPILGLFNSAGEVLRSNDDWRAEQEAEIMATGLAPTNDREAAVIATLNPGTYTAIVSGKNDGTGIGLVEVYDLEPGTDSQMGNISTRGNVLIDDGVMIGGFILSGSDSTRVVVRALGPTLEQFGVGGTLQDPTLDIHNANGMRFAGNDNWRSTQEQELIAANLAPQDDREAAVLLPLPAGSYTAIVRGKNGTTGVALVEAYLSR
jgi:hypothetical protein